MDNVTTPATTGRHIAVPPTPHAAATASLESAQMLNESPLSMNLAKQALRVGMKPALSKPQVAGASAFRSSLPSNQKVFGIGVGS
jgi:hypothetical protein